MPPATTNKTQDNLIIKAILKHYSNTQAIYLFGTHGTEDEWPDSDADIALLLEHDEANQAGSLAMSDLRFELEDILGKKVDLINLRMVSTVFQKEVIAADRRIYTADEYAADEFDMLVISFYQNLNDERAGILEEIYSSGRICAL